MDRFHVGSTVTHKGIVCVVHKTRSIGDNRRLSNTSYAQHRPGKYPAARVVFQVLPEATRDGPKE